MSYAFSLHNISNRFTNILILIWFILVLKKLHTHTRVNTDTPPHTHIVLKRPLRLKKTFWFGWKHTRRIHNNSIKGFLMNHQCWTVFFLKLWYYLSFYRLVDLINSNWLSLDISILQNTFENEMKTITVPIPNQ